MKKIKKEEYFVNRNSQINGKHEVHKESCFFLSIEKNRISLGLFCNAQDALKKAKEIYPAAEVCSFCTGKGEKKFSTI
jgi:hypothetical protein